MPTVGFHPPTRDMDIEQLSELIAKTFKELEWLLSGNVDFKNIKALGITTKNLKAEAITAEKIKAGTITATQIEANSITADRMDVTELSAIAANLGTIVAGVIYGAYIATANGTYPRIEFSSTDKLLKAMQTATNYIAIDPDFTGDPTLYFDNGVNIGSIGYAADVLFINAATGDIQLSGNSDVNILTLGGNIKAQSMNGSITDIVASINGKANAFSGVSGTVYVASTLGGPTNTAITFTNGIRTS